MSSQRDVLHTSKEGLCSMLLVNIRSKLRVWSFLLCIGYNRAGTPQPFRYVGYRLADRGIFARFSSGAKDFSLYTLKTGSGAHPPPCYTHDALLARKHPVFGADYSSSSVELKNEWRYTSTLHIPSRPAQGHLHFYLCVKLIKEQINLSSIRDI
jgi:hypothetical protein